MTAAQSAGGLDAHVRVRREHFAVDVALRVAPGETVAVMGPSGAGKSTLVGALAGLVPLEAGEISIGGRIVERTTAPRVQTPPMRRGVVLLGQDARLFPHLTARENVAFGPRAAGMARARARTDADTWLERVGLPGAGSRRTGELSGGEQQRVAVARALAASPRVVLLDEPLVALDPETASGIRAMLREQLAGVTTVAVTHDAVDAVSLAERLLVIERGILTQSGPVRDVLASPASRFVAAVAGVNRIVGRVVGGVWEGEGMRVSVAPGSVDGAAVAAVFRPGRVRVLGADEPRGENTWTARVRALEPTPAGVRVQAGACAVDLSVAALASVTIGTELVLRIDPADVRFVTASSPPA